MLVADLKSGHERHLQGPRGEHGDQAIFHLAAQLKTQQDRDGQDHQQDVGDDAHRAVKVVELRCLKALRAELRTVVPAAADRRAAEQVEQHHHGRRGEDVGDDSEADSSECWLRGEAQVEAQHGHLREWVGHTCDDDRGVTVLVGC